jgi:hypothetical protein
MPEVKMSQVWKVGEMTEYGRIVNKGGELLPEFVFHGPMQTFRYLNPNDPWAYDTEWCTKDDTWFGARKIHSIGFDSNGPYFMHVSREENIEADGTVGTVGPLTLVLPDNSISVAVDEHKVRHHTGPQGIVEAPRRRHGSPELMPAVIGVSFLIEEYGKDKLGMSLLNSARIVAAKDRLAYVGSELTVVYAGVKPALNGTFIWMEVEKFLLTSLDGPSKGVVALAVALEILPNLDKDRIKLYQAELPTLIESVRL